MGLAISSILIVILFTLSKATSPSLVVQPPGQATQQIVTLPNALTATIIGCVVSSLFALVLHRTIGHKARITLIVVGVTATVLSLISPLTATSSITTLAWLSSFHLAVAVPMLMCLSSALSRPMK